MADTDFQLTDYRRLLQSAIENGYAFLKFPDIGHETGPRSCLLRHDVDSELLACGPMLDVERDLGVQATYFLMIRSTAYNLFSVEASAMVGRMLADGHSIGLHFMGERCSAETVDAVAGEVQREARWLEQEFGTKISVVSFHQPTQTILDAQVTIPGLANTYNSSQMGRYFYVSDTNMTWRHHHPVEIFSRQLYERLQLLIHPMWWTDKPLEIIDKWRNVLRRNQRAVIEHWQSRERTLAGFDLRIDEDVS
jgi:peptidoglycan/xylan/chitin deacetylase (PgdA/CDA1 family)